VAHCRSAIHHPKSEGAEQAGETREAIHRRAVVLDDRALLERGLNGKS
jgi:hypothetical protein